MTLSSVLCLHLKACFPTKSEKRVDDGMEVMPHLKLRDDLGIQYAILPGDPARVERIAEQLEDVEELEFNREYKSIAGTYRGIRMLAVSTGIGGPSTGIAVEELARIGVTHAIRIGSCGALQKEIRLGDLILVQGAVRDEGTSRTYIDSIYPAIPDFELMNACVEAVFTPRSFPITNSAAVSISQPSTPLPAHSASISSSLSV